MNNAKAIFISYRRSNSTDITGRIYDRLAAHFGEASVFKDVDSIPFGVNFRHHLEQAVSYCPVLLAIIDPNWLEATDNRGRLKLANPSDWVRVEIETALKRDRLVIPVLVGDAMLPNETELPDSLKALAYRQSAPVRCDPDFHRDLDRLIHRVEEVFSSLVVGGASTAVAKPAANLIDELVAALAKANQPAQTPTLSRRRWLRLMGLGVLGGGSAVAMRYREPALQALATVDIPATVSDLSTLPKRVQQAVDQLDSSSASWATDAPSSSAATEPPGPYTYESVNVNEFGVKVAQVKFATSAYQELMLDGPHGPVILPLVAIAGGQFVFGAPPTEPGYDPSHPVQTIATVESFWMSIYPITQAQWQAVAMLPTANLDLSPTPAQVKGDDHPVEQVSWPEAMEWCDRLSRLIEHRAGQGIATQPPLSNLRLPTEAEWEYACRAKTTTPFHTGLTLTTGLANYNGSQPYRQEPVGLFRGTTTAVGSFGNANDFGLYDMHGNVLEWCSPIGDARRSATWQVVRGGSWQSPAEQCRSAYRQGLRADTRSNQVGFRIVATGRTPAPS
ncbi:SUMF1/EgtB/PvdO family nonheme iron enzyme [Nodosilinea sp. LEGE 07088]|uniref:SUMF1/EgtB/PvdO family nonheme iron enzyme n=1 Tax=Nodosilinea sp. LEGE 07088 TaxID=2777968 RepID=UPI0018809A94|nr:SUMF1/EgtB/PvdO family nonheme iron enzyme [Nodosilinea sp. LEGE 07088]MBE9140144.1 SUMF1/EgtB/PvdO family nonheme iron enzyme [Nodosilinea sp. LEGE 07088]